MAARESGAIHPTFERFLRRPPRVDEIRVAGVLVRGSQQLESLEALCLGDLTSAIRETGLEIAAALVGDGDGVDDYV
jgi:hypothetical protein